MAKTIFGLVNPERTAREVVERFVDKARRDLPRMTENYRISVRATKDNPEKVRAMEQKMRIYYETLAERYAELSAVFVAAKYNIPYEEALEMIRTGIVRVG